MVMLHFNPQVEAFYVPLSRPSLSNPISLSPRKLSSFSRVQLRRRVGQRSAPPAAKHAHDAEADVEQGEGIRDEAAHALHAPDGAEHAARAVRAPHDGGGGHDDAKGRVHGHDDADQARRDEGEEAVAQHGGGARKGERRGEVAADAAAWLLGLRGGCVVVGRIRGGG